MGGPPSGRGWPTAALLPRLRDLFHREAPVGTWWAACKVLWQPRSSSEQGAAGEAVRVWAEAGPDEDGSTDCWGSRLRRVRWLHCLSALAADCGAGPAAAASAEAAAKDLLRDSLLYGLDWGQGGGERHPLRARLPAPGGPKRPRTEGPQRAEVALPLRAVLAGGWTDTPPICLERGGAVCNIAITFSGRPVVVATAEVTDGSRAPVLLRDEDGGAEMAVSDFAALGRHGEDSGALALHRAVLCFLLCPWWGSTPRRAPEGLPGELGPALERLLGPGKGVCLASRTDDLPRGSGLGTSSILALACIRAAGQVLGAAAPAGDSISDEEVAWVLAVEQMMGTGGGWQDQVGGGCGGVKLTVHPAAASAGMAPLSFNIKRLPLSAQRRELLQSRMAVVYAGERRRRASQINSSVLRKWHHRDPAAVRTMDRIHQSAIDIFGALQGFAALADTDDEAAVDGALRRIGDLLDEDMALYRELDGAAIFSPEVDELRALLAPWLHGAKLMGSGGGGFIVGFLRAGRTREALAAHLRGACPEARLTDCRIADGGP